MPTPRHIIVCLVLFTFSSPGRAAVVLPVRSRLAHGHRYRGRMLYRNTSLPIDGATATLGYYYVTLGIGTPRQEFDLLLDTGSTMTYMPCTGCGSNCGSAHAHKPFNADASKTAAFVECGEPACSCMGSTCSCGDEGRCTYSIRYEEGSSSRGPLVTDVVWLQDGLAPVNGTFGCEQSETGQIKNQRADGLMGMGDSRSSLLNQLVNNGVVDNTFAMCLGPVSGKGQLLLGDVGFQELEPRLAYTPRATNQQSPYFYRVELQQIRVGASVVDVPAWTYNYGGGTLLDSGTTFTYLPEAAFKVVAEQVDSHAKQRGLKPAPQPYAEYWDDICYQGGPDDIQQPGDLYPTITLTFPRASGGGAGAGADTVDLDMLPVQYMWKHPGMAGAWCLGIFKQGASQRGAILGGIAGRSMFVHFDRRRNRIGWMRADCDADPTAPSPAALSRAPSGSSAPQHSRKPSPSSASPAASVAREDHGPEPTPAPAPQQRDGAAVSALAAFFFLLALAAAAVGGIVWYRRWSLARTASYRRAAALPDELELCTEEGPELVHAAAQRRKAAQSGVVGLLSSAVAKARLPADDPLPPVNPFAFDGPPATGLAALPRAEGVGGSGSSESADAAVAPTIVPLPSAALSSLRFMDDDTEHCLPRRGNGERREL